MQDIRRVLGSAARRLFLLDFFRVLAVTLTVGLVALLVARLVERTFGLASIFDPLWTRIWAGTGLAVVAGALVWCVVIRRKSLAVARELDLRANLRESLSTALCVEKNPDPWAVAVVETATQTARRVVVRDAIPIEAPRLWPMPVGAALALMIFWMSFPLLDVLNRFKEEQAQEAKQKEIVNVKAELAQKQEKIEELLKKAKVDLTSDKDADAGFKGDEKREIDPDAARRTAVKQLTDLSDRLSSMKEGEKAAQLDALKEAMRQLKQPGSGPLDDFSRSLARGDFNKASSALDQLNKQLADGNMSKDQKDKLEAQLKNLANQLEKLSQDQKQVEKKLQEQGLDKKTAEHLAKKALADPKALKEALEQMKNLSAEQMQQLMKMAQAACEACNNAGQMSDAMQKMAQGLTQEGLQQDGMAGMEQLSQQLSEMEMMQNDMESLDAALAEAKSQLSELSKCLGGSRDGEGEGNCQGLGEWREGANRSRSGGQGGPGRGDSPRGPDEMPEDFAYEKKKANTQTTSGAIIGSRLVYGEQVKGEAKEAFSDAVASSSRAASEAIESNTIPREYHDAVKHYFGTLGEKVKKDKAPAASPTEAPKK